MASKDKHRRERQVYASDLHIKSAAMGAPPNAVKRVLQRMPAESVEEAIHRAEAMLWWPAVIDPIPRGNVVRYWVWFCDPDLLPG